jgi:hypothetical protein
LDVSGFPFDLAAVFGLSVLSFGDGALVFLAAAAGADFSRRAATGLFLLVGVFFSSSGRCSLSVGRLIYDISFWRSIFRFLWQDPYFRRAAALLSLQVRGFF